MTDGEVAPRVLVVTNMWPSSRAPSRGIFVREQLRAVQRRAPDWRFDVLEIDGRRGRSQYLRGIFRIRRRLRDGFDLVHAHYGLTGAAATLARARPLVVTFHGSDVYIPWQRSISRRAARSADARIFVSERLRERMEGVDGDVVPCGVDLEVFRADRAGDRAGDRAAARRELGLETGGAGSSARELVVLFPGDPASAVKDYPLFEATLEALRERLAAPAPVVRELTLGGLRPSEVAVRLRAADVVLLTSGYEGAGSVAKEAVACGTPVVSVDVGDVPETISGLDGCAIVGRDPAALAAALEASLATEPRWDGHEHLRALRLDRDAIGDRVLAVYRRVLERGQGA